MRLVTFISIGATVALLAIVSCATQPRFAGLTPEQTCEKARSAEVPFEQSDLAQGKKLFGTQCAQCHAISDSAPRLPGPHLAGILGRRVGEVESFRYSKAFRGRTDSWTLDALDRYIEDPEWFDPETDMKYDGMRSPDGRRAIIAYLSCEAR